MVVVVVVVTTIRFLHWLNTKAIYVTITNTLF
jgi:hypothetical protein